MTSRGKKVDAVEWLQNVDDKQEIVGEDYQ